MRKVWNLVACIGGIAVLSAAPSTAYGSDDSTVSTWFEKTGLSYVQGQQAQNVQVDDEPIPYANANGVSDPVEIYSWSDAFVRGDTAIQNPTESTGEWHAALLEDGKPVGVMIATYDSADGVVTPVGYGEDPDVANAVVKVGEGAQLVLDMPSYGLYELRDGMVTGLNTPALIEAPKPISLTEFQVVIAERYSHSLAESESYDGEAVGGGGPLAPAMNGAANTWGWVALSAGAGAALIAIVVIIRKRRMETRVGGSADLTPVHD